MTEVVENEVVIHAMAGHRTGFGQEDISTMCDRWYSRKRGFPGYFRGDFVITLTKKHTVSETARRVTCQACKKELRVEEKAGRNRVQ